MATDTVLQRIGRMASERQELAIVALIVLVVAMLIVPLPTVLVDFLIACNIVLALLIFLGTFYVGKVLEFSSFPAILLISTLFRLALSISTTRLILLQGDAGQIITTFGEFVVGDSLVVGLVVFAIVTIVQFIVITKGSERVAEVVARFSLDAMPGKQMSIDSDVRAGLLDNDAVSAARRRLEKESQLYGAFDGAMKFVKGDAIAGIVIIIVNLVGGVAAGTLGQGMKLSDAIATYSLLSIGDGLVAQIPALLIAVGAGFIVTRVSDDTNNLGKQIVGELFGQSPVLLICALLSLGVGMLPGFPFGAFALLAAVLGAVFLRRHWVAREGKGTSRESIAMAGSVDEHGDGLPDGEHAASGEIIPTIVLLPDAARPHIDVARLEHDLQRSVQFALGISVPSVVVRFGARVAPEQACVLLNEMHAATLGVVFGRCFVPEFNEDVRALELDCIGIADPANVPLRGPALAWWVAQSEGARVEQLGYRIQSAQHVLEARFVRVIARNIGELFGVQETKNVLDGIEEKHPELLKETYRHMPVIRLTEIFQRLLAERVPLRNVRLVLEAIAQWAPREKDALVLTEHVRATLAKTISHHFLRDNARRVIVVAPDSEDRIRASIRQVAAGSFLQMSPEDGDAFVDAVGSQFERLNLVHASNAVLLCAVDIRRFVKKLVERRHPDLDVVSFAEVAEGIEIDVVGSV
ncbi:MAG: EscV/YscV/HrcV family type III secretion system export apparatus protein [Pararobbsia sp.]